MANLLAPKMLAGTPVMEAADKGIIVVVLSCFETVLKMTQN